MIENKNILIEKNNDSFFLVVEPVKINIGNFNGSIDLNKIKSKIKSFIEKKFELKKYNIDIENVSLQVNIRKRKNKIYYVFLAREKNNSIKIGYYHINIDDPNDMEKKKEVEAVAFIIRLYNHLKYF